MQSEFLVLDEDTIRQPYLAKSAQRYLALCPGTWLMPARMLINTESMVGYNKQLKQAAPGMKLGFNDEVNTSTKIGHCPHGRRTVENEHGRPTNHPFHKAPGVPAQPDKSAPV